MTYGKLLYVGPAMERGNCIDAATNHSGLHPGAR
jgi:hypothetical protein